MTVCSSVRRVDVVVMLHACSRRFHPGKYEEASPCFSMCSKYIAGAFLELLEDESMEVPSGA